MLRNLSATILLYLSVVHTPVSSFHSIMLNLRRCARLRPVAARPSGSSSSPFAATMGSVFAYHGSCRRLGRKGHWRAYSKNMPSESFMDFSSDYHAPVMVKNVLSKLPHPKSSSTLTLVDLTCGGGGHSLAMLEHYAAFMAEREQGRNDPCKITLYGVDQDEESAKQTRVRLKDYCNQESPLRFVSVTKNFGDLTLSDFGGAKADFILGDLGVSSHQIDSSDRGFSYSNSGPLDMRMSKARDLTAKTILNEFDEPTIHRILVDLGDEDWKVARKISRSIIDSRPLETTSDLVAAVEKVVPKWHKTSARRGALKTCSRTFQALRVAVNDEVGVLHRLFDDVLPVVSKVGGVVAIMTYQSMEDRIVKRAFNEHYFRGGNLISIKKTDIVKDVYGNDVTDGDKVWKVLNRGGEKPDKGEIDANRRARSARLRVAMREVT